MIFVIGTIWLHDLRVLPGFADGCWCKLNYSARDAVYSITAECLCPSCSQQPHVTKHAHQLSLWAPSMSSPCRRLCGETDYFFPPGLLAQRIWLLFSTYLLIRLPLGSYRTHGKNKKWTSQSVWLINQCWLDILHTYQYWTDLTMIWVCWCKAFTRQQLIVVT